MTVSIGGSRTLGTDVVDIANVNANANYVYNLTTVNVDESNNEMSVL